MYIRSSNSSHCTRWTRTHNYVSSIYVVLDRWKQVLMTYTHVCFNSLLSYYYSIFSNFFYFRLVNSCMALCLVSRTGLTHVSCLCFTVHFYPGGLWMFYIVSVFSFRTHQPATKLTMHTCAACNLFYTISLFVFNEMI